MFCIIICFIAITYGEMFHNNYLWLGVKGSKHVIIIIIIKYNIYIAPYSQVLYGAVHCYYLLINFKDTFFDTDVGPRQNLARMCR